MQNRQTRSFAQGLYYQKARYPLFCVMGLYIFLQLLAHDGQIYNAIDAGLSDAGALSELYFPQWTNDQGTQIAQGLVAGMAALIGYAIIIKAAQRHYNKHGIAVE